MILLRCIFLHGLFQRHVSALVMNHRQVDYFFLVRQNMQLAMLLLFFNVLLTVHLSITLVINQLNAQILVL